MYKTLGGYTWSGFWSEPLSNDECSLTMPPEELPIVPEDDSEESIKQSAQQFHLALESVKSVYIDYYL